MKLCQLEFFSKDPDESFRFFEVVLGWKKVPVAIQDQIIIDVPPDSPYGISIRKSHEMDSTLKENICPYFETAEDLDVISRNAKNFGALVKSEPKFVTGYGDILLIEEKAGLTVGLYRAIPDKALRP